MPISFFLITFYFYTQIDVYETQKSGNAVESHSPSMETGCFLIVAAIFKLKFEYPLHSL